MRLGLVGCFLLVAVLLVGQPVPVQNAKDIADSLANAGNWAKACNMYQVALRQAKDVDTYYALVDCRLALKLWNKALNTSYSMLRQYPNQVEPWCAIGRSYQGKAVADTARYAPLAREFFEKGLQKYPDSFLLHLHYAQALEQFSQPQKAANHYHRALLVSSSDLSAFARYQALRAKAGVAVFYLKSPEAQSVFVAGDFNNWNPTDTAMTNIGGAWIAEKELMIGTYRYKYVIDATRWVLDPHNPQTGQDNYNTPCSVLKFGE